MNSLIYDTLNYLREIAKTTSSVLATEDEMRYFASRICAIPKETFTPSPLPPQQPLQPLPRQPKPLAASPLISIVVETSIAPPVTPVEKRSHHEMRQMVEKTFPTLELRDTILDDTHAQKRARLWEQSYLAAQVIVIAFGEVGPGLEFLKNVTYAIDRLIAPAHLVEGSTLEKEKGWDLLLQSSSLKSILCSPWNAWKSTSLSQYYSQNGSTQEQFLGSHKLLFLESSLTYLKNRDQKRKLWQLINTQLLS